MVLVILALSDHGGSCDHHRSTSSGISGTPSWRNARIGGDAAGAGNLISGNGGWGIELTAQGASVVRGNRIGIDASGDALPNALGGISVDNGLFFGDTVEVVDNIISQNNGPGVQLTGTESHILENVITLNEDDGVAVSDTRATRNTISRNEISENGGLGIDLDAVADDGVTPNDTGDGDGGANFRQNFPAILQVSPDHKKVSGTLNSRPSRNYRIELFGTSECDPSGYGEGETFLASTEVPTDGSGNAPFSVTLQDPLPGGDVVTATATDLPLDTAGNTSEFSRCVDVPPPSTGTIIVDKVTNPAGDPQSFSFDASGGSYADFSLTDTATPNSQELAAGNYAVSEAVPSAWDLTSATCSDGSPTSNIDLEPGETVTCTFTNTKRGMVDLRKLTNGIPRPDLDIKFMLYRDGGTPGDLTGSDTQLEELSTLGDADGLLQFVTKLVPGTLYTICENPVPAGWTSMWTITFQVGGQIVTPYNPNANDTPPEDVGVRCFDFTVDPAQTKHFEVRNDFPGGDPRTIGYWKNWNRCTGGGQAANAARNGGAAAGFFLIEDLLPQLVGDFSVTTCAQAVKLLSKQDQAGRNKSSDAAYELGAQLLAARFNLAAGAETCAAVQQAVLDGQALLDQINFTGSGDYLGSKSKDARRSQALSLAATLDRYNNGNLC